MIFNLKYKPIEFHLKAWDFVFDLKEIIFKGFNIPIHKITNITIQIVHR